MSVVHARGALFSAFVFFWVFPSMLRAQQNPADTAPQATLTIDLNDAMERARANSPQIQSAALGMELAREDRHQAKTAFYPTINYFNQYIYTQGNSTPSGVFVANDGVHVYSNQAVVHQEAYSPARLMEYRRASAFEALAAARKEIAVRGLVLTVYQNYYGVITAQRHYANARLSIEEARRFVEISRRLEQGGEVARADVVKAELTLQQRERDFQEAQLAIDKAKISMAVLLFPDFRTDFNLIDDLESVGTLPPAEQLLALARTTSPDLRAAEQMVHQEALGVAIARSAYWPTLTFDYVFGLNSNQYSIRDAEGHNRIGSAAQATLNIPVFNWGATRSKISTADLRRRQAELDLTMTRRQLESTVQSFYAEAKAALTWLDSFKRSLNLAGESFRLTNLRYEAGEVTALEIVDAQTTLTQARNSYDDALARYRLALANLQTLTVNY